MFHGNVKATRSKCFFLIWFCFTCQKKNIYAHKFLEYSVNCWIQSNPFFLFLGCNVNKFWPHLVHWSNVHKGGPIAFLQLYLRGCNGINETEMSKLLRSTLSETESLCSILQRNVEIFLEVFEWLVFGWNGDGKKAYFWDRKFDASIKLHQHRVSFWKHVSPRPKTAEVD